MGDLDPPRATGLGEAFAFARGEALAEARELDRTARRGACCPGCLGLGEGRIWGDVTVDQGPADPSTPSP